jgi:hypothetical protein
MLYWERVKYAIKIHSILCHFSRWLEHNLVPMYFSTSVSESLRKTIGCSGNLGPCTNFHKSKSHNCIIGCLLQPMTRLHMFIFRCSSQGMLGASITCGKVPLA